jgi:hypothetical protein
MNYETKLYFGSGRLGIKGNWLDLDTRSREVSM